jgi:hypothetical protein
MALLPYPTLQVDPLQRVTDLLVAITALLGSLVAIYTLLKQISRNRNMPKEVSPLQFVRIQHQPVERKDWQGQRIRSLVVAVGCLIALVGYSLLLFLVFPPRGEDTGRVGIYLVFVVVLFFNMVVFFTVYARLGKTPEDASTFFFQSATVEVDATVEKIFAECLRALKRLNAYTLEFDITQQYLEATLGMSLNSLGGTLCIQIVQGKDQHYAIQVEVERRFLHHMFANSSWVITSFIRQLLGR